MKTMPVLQDSVIGTTAEKLLSPVPQPRNRCSSLEVGDVRMGEVAASMHSAPPALPHIPEGGPVGDQGAVRLYIRQYDNGAQRLGAHALVLAFCLWLVAPYGCTSGNTTTVRTGDGARFPIIAFAFGSRAAAMCGCCCTLVASQRCTGCRRRRGTHLVSTRTPRVIQSVMQRACCSGAGPYSTLRALLPAFR